VGKGDTVLVKPNLHGGPGHTSARLMRAACQWAFARGARRVVLGDGPFWGITSQAAQGYFERAGVLQACAETGAEPAYFHEHPYRLHHPQSPHVPRVLGVSHFLYDCDVVINLPVLKTHFNTLITVAIKNLKGLLRPVDKRRLHEMELHLALGVVAQLVRPEVTVTLCDALTAYEGMGPSSGTPVEMNLLLASGDFVALDAVVCDLSGVEPASARLVRECAALGVGVGDLDQIQVVGEKLSEHRRRFKLPWEALADDFPGLTVHSRGACSGCTMNLCAALSEVSARGQKVTCDSILIGPGPETEADLLVGKCAAQGKGRKADAEGCPPVIGEIRRALSIER